jgi:hypothetical protein
MKKSGLADSPFFAPPKPEVEVTTPPPPAISEKPKVQIKRVASKKNVENTLPAVQSEPENINEMNESKHASNNASMQASKQPLNHDTIIETIRKAVKYVGKDSSTYRFTPEEKKALLEIGFSYKMQGYKTSENEIMRIAINFLLEDHRENGRNSVLQMVLDALRQ